MQAILKVHPDATFVQSESLEYSMPTAPTPCAKAEILNARRFLSLDLSYGRRIESEMYEFQLDNVMTREEYHSFLGRRLKPHTASWATTTASPTSTADARLPPIAMQRMGRESGRGSKGGGPEPDAGTSKAKT